MADMTNRDSGDAKRQPTAGASGAKVVTAEKQSSGKGGLIATIVILALIIVAGAVVAVLAATGFFETTEDPAAIETPVAGPTESPEPELVIASYVTPQTWCTALRTSPNVDFLNSPSWIWAAFVLRTDDGELAVEGTLIDVGVPGADLDPIETQVLTNGVVEVIVPVSSLGFYEFTEVAETRDGRFVPGPFIDVEVSDDEFGPECAGPGELALDLLVLESELFD